MATKKVRVPNLITGKWLEKFGACDEGVDVFLDLYPNGAKPSLEVLNSIPSWDLEWLGTAIRDIVDFDAEEPDDYAQYIMNNITWPSRKIDEAVKDLPKRKVPTNITADWLESMGACEEGIQEFQDKFPGGVAKTTVQNLSKMSDDSTYWIAFWLSRGNKATQTYFDVEWGKLKKKDSKNIAKLLFPLLEVSDK